MGGSRGSPAYRPQQTSWFRTFLAPADPLLAFRTLRLLVEAGSIAFVTAVGAAFVLPWLFGEHVLFETVAKTAGGLAVGVGMTTILLTLLTIARVLRRS